MIGKVLDASAFASLVRGNVGAAALFATMRTLSLPLYLPSLALGEVRAVRPDAGPELAELLGHPSLVLGELDATGAASVDRLLPDAKVFDALAGHVVFVGRQRGRPSVRDTAEDADPAERYQVPTADQTAAAITRAQEALAEIHARREADARLAEEDHRLAQLARWHEQDRAAEQAADADRVDEQEPAWQD